MKTLGGATEVKLLGDGDKVAQMAKLNILIHMLEIIIEWNKILDVSCSWRENWFKEFDMTSAVIPEIEIRAMQMGEDGAAFRILNEEWITHFFKMEEKDEKTLADPQGTILAIGGHIYFIYADGVAVGCLALVPMQDGVFELAKMAVRPTMRGLGVGRKLLEDTVAQARALGIRELFLGTSTKLSNAIHLYEAIGFTHIPVERRPTPAYSRADVFMEMTL